MDRLVGGWAMAIKSWGVLRHDRELMLFPAVSFVLTLLVSIGFLLPFWASGAFLDFANGQVDPVMLGVLFLYYLTTYTIVIFCNVAVVAGALIRLQGGEPTLSDGFGVAFDRLPAIIGYAAIAATVGVALRTLAERTGIIGRLILGGVGVAWSLATFLVAPVLVVEKVGPVQAILRSAGLLRTSWGEQIGGNIGIGLVFTLLSIGVAVIAAALFAVVVDTSAFAASAVVVLAVLIIAALALLGTTLQAVFTASVYRYAVTGDGGTMFRDGPSDAEGGFGPGAR
ncbi:MAG: hypothetical protein KF809_04245 [Chloroflexi bacterium]|nr:hypothetical protein [Chloroflexota bacterium]